MEYIIYTFGQTEELKNVLIGLSMMFDPTNSPFFVTGTDGSFKAGSAALLAALLATIGVMSSYFSEGKVTGAPGPLIGLALYGMLAVPKAETTYIQDMYSGHTVQVSNLPIGIAMLGHSMSGISRGMMDAFETNFTTVGIDNNMTDKNGFLSPLKMLTAMREVNYTRLPTHLQYNIASYLYFCLHKKAIDNPSAPEDEVFSSYRYSTSSDPITYLLSDGIYEGSSSAEYMDPTTGSESVDTCETLNTTLSSDSAAGGIRFYFTQGADFGRNAFAKMINNNFAYFGDCADPTCLSNSAAITKVKSSMATILGSQEAANRYLETALSVEVNKLASLIGTVDYTGIDNMATTMATLVTDARSSEVLEGETYLRFMMKAMNAMMMLFYAAFPIVLIVAVAKGVNSMVYIGGYFAMGLWVYSWLPVATIINFTTTSSLVEVFGLLNGSILLTPDSIDTYVQEALDALAVGSNLLAATPIITLALISGSMFALTSVASSSASPSGNTSSAVGQNVAKPGSADYAKVQSKYVAAGHGANALSGTNAAMSRLANTSFNTQALAKDSYQASQEVATTAMDNFATTGADTFSKMNQVMQGNSSTFQSTFGNATGAHIESSLQTSLAKAGVDTTGMSHSQMASAGGALMAGKLPMAVGAHGNETLNKSTLSQRSEEFRADMAQSMAQLNTLEQSTSDVNAEQRSNLTEAGVGRTVSNAQAYQTATQAAETQRLESEAEESRGTSFSATFAELGNEWTKRNGGYDFSGAVGSLAGVRSDTAEELGMDDDSHEFSQNAKKYANTHGYGNDGGDGLAAVIGTSQKNAEMHRSNIAKLEGKALSGEKLNKAEEKELSKAKEGYAMEKEFMDNVVQAVYGNHEGISTNSQFTKLRNEGSEIPGKVAAQENKVASGQTQQTQEHDEGKGKVKSADFYNPQSLNSARDNVDALSSSYNQMAGFSNDEFGAARYGSDYLGDEALNQAANEVSEGSTFSDLNSNDKREVIAGQQQKALNAFVADSNNLVGNQSGLTQRQQAEFQSGFSQLGQIYDKQMGMAVSNHSPAHSQGTVAAGEMRGLNNVGAGVAEYASAISSAVNNASQQNDLLATQMGELFAEQDGFLNTSWGLAVGYDEGIDAGANDRIGGLIEQTNASVANGDMTLNGQNSIIDGQIERGHEEGEVSDNFQSIYDGYRDSGFSGASSVAMALGDVGLNNNGVPERMVDDYVDIATNIGSIATGVYTGGKLAENLSSVARSDSTGDGQFKDKTGAVDSKATEKFEKGASKLSKVLKIGGGVVGAGITAGIHGNQFFNDREQNKVDALSSSIVMSSNSVSSNVESIKQPELRQNIRNDVANEMFDKTFTQQNGYSAEQVEQARSQLTDSSGNFVEGSIGVIGESAATVSQFSEEYTGPMSRDFISSYNSNNRAERDI